jgi:hypothetical protein
MMPSEVWELASIPLLGSGKVDTMAVAKLVAERATIMDEPRTRAIG